MNNRKTFSTQMRLRIFNKFKGHCAYCGREFASIKEMQVDHVIPLKNGGSNEFDNLYPACRKCNFYKDVYSLERFREQLEQLQNRLKTKYIYTLALNFKLIEEKENKVVFYFEKEEATKETKNDLSQNKN